jgi:hypothetical protein
LAMRAEKIQESSLCADDVPRMLGCETGHVCNKLYIHLSTRPPAHD